jgi:hypothetical protein
MPFDRRHLMLPLAHLLPALPGLTALSGSLKTYAPSPVWRDSTTKEVQWCPLPKRKAVKLWHRARDFERRTRQPGRQDGALGRNGLAVLYALIFDFLDYATGQLDPAIATIAKKANICERSAHRGLANLKHAGVLNWLRRCTESFKNGRFTLEQETNAYAILPASQWRGYEPPADPPQPDPGTWGDHPPMPDAVTAAAIEHQAGAGVRSVLRELESDPGNTVAAALARLQRALLAKEAPQIPGLPA